MKIYRYTLAVVGLALTLMGSETNAFEDDPFSITHGPYLQQLTEASVMIVWFTSRESVSRVEYGTGDNYRTFPQWGSLLHIATANEHGLVDAYTTAHKVLISGLQPGKTYKYRVVSKEFLQFKPYEVIYGDSIVSPIYQFETLDPNKSSFSFIQLSDIHEHAARLDTMLQAVDWENIDLVFYTGDAIDYFEEESQIFDGFLDMSVQHYATEKPLVYIRGNHETRGRYARRLMDFFPTESQRYYYSFNQGPVHFIVMDSGEDKEDEHPVYADLVDFDPYREAQAEWLKQDVQSEAFKRATFRVALFHIPPYGERHRHGEDHLTDLWAPVFNEAGIDLMLCGHRHRFSRHDPETGKNTYPLVITGINNVTRVDVTPEKLQVIVSHKNGDVVDTFTVPEKRTGTSAR